MSEWHLYERWLSRPKQPASQHLILFRSWAQRKDWKRPRLILVSAQHIFFFFFFFSGVFSGPDGMSWPGGDFVDACRGFTRLSLQLFARLFARRWCIPAEIESWRYLFSCTHVYLCISSNLDQHSRIYRNSLGGERGGTVSQCRPVQLHWSSRRLNVGSRTTALEISTLYLRVWASPPPSPQGYRCSLNTDELRGRTVHKCIQREELFRVTFLCYLQHRSMFFL